MTKGKRSLALPVTAVLAAVLIIGFVFLALRNAKLKGDLDDIKGTVLKLQNEKLLSGKVVDPNDYPVLPAVITTNIKKQYSGKSLTFSYIDGWVQKEEKADDGVNAVVLATNDKLLDLNAIPDDQGKVTVRTSQMSWVSSAEDLKKDYTVDSRKFTVNGKQAFETTNQDKTNNSTWVDTYIFPESNQQSFIIIRVQPSKSKPSIEQYETVLQSVKLK